MATGSENYIGIDVSKDSLDVAVLGERRSRQVRNSRKSIESLAVELGRGRPRLIVVEATGGYEEGVSEATAGLKAGRREYGECCIWRC
jgi:transposase